MRPATRWTLRIGYLLSVALLFEVAFRSYLRTQYGEFWFHPSAVVQKRYPALNDVLARRIHRDGHTMKVLFLGASTISPKYGDVVERVRAHLRDRGIEANLINLSDRALTTRDALFQYQLLQRETFDAVVLYHGINEVRANNCPPDVFQSDYSHYAWYEEINVAMRHSTSLRFTVLPYCADLLAHRIRQQVRKPRYLSAHQPPPDWMAYGADLKTPPCFRANLEAVLDLARRRGDTPILVTFAWYVPANYTEEAFRCKRLDYGRMEFPIELWGYPTNVVAGLEAHNDQIRHLAEAHTEARLLDMKQRMPASGRYFDDICHFTRAGCDLFADALAAELSDLWQRHYPAHARSDGHHARERRGAEEHAGAV